MFGKDIHRKLDYAHPIVLFVLGQMAHDDKTIVSNLEVYREPSDKRRGVAAQKYVLREMQMTTQLLHLDKCEACGGYGVTGAIMDDFYWAKKCRFCGNVTDKKFDQELKDTHQKLEILKKQLTEAFASGKLGDELADDAAKGIDAVVEKMLEQE